MSGEVDFVSDRIKAFVASMTISKDYARLGPEFQLVETKGAEQRIAFAAKYI